jgi:hypothetical protein
MVLFRCFVVMDIALIERFSVFSDGWSLLRVLFIESNVVLVDVHVFFVLNERRSL